MYIGSTDTRGLMHCLWEIIDNAVDEALGGFGKEISVTLRSDGGISVADRGRGIPVDVEPRTGLSGVEVVFTKLHAGGKFGNGSYNATGGLHGVGSSVVNALASRLDVEVDRNGATWAMSFRRGTPGSFDGPGPNARFTAGGGLRKVGRTAKGLTGTRVTFWPDRQIFLKDAAITDVIRLRGQDRFTETVPMLDAEGHMEPRDVERDLDMDIAVRWGTGYESTIRSYVNIIATPKGGTHVAGFERALTRTFTEVLQRTRLLKAGEEIVKDDVLEGMTAIITVRLAEPQFEGQTKEVLGTPAVTGLGNKAVRPELTPFFTP